MTSRLRQIVRGIGYLWLVVGLTLLGIGTVELCSTLLLRLVDRGTQGDPRLRADAYGNAPWVADYYAEFHRSRDDMRWTPYVYWRRQPRRSAFINVDERGLRATVSSTSPNAVKIFMFGGSTMWGTGVRDDFTIPSALARELERHGVAATVTNYGETGWVTTQELIALELELRKGLRPDLVIFYDGINDTWAAFQQGVAGIPHNEYNRVKEFNVTLKSVRARLGLLAHEAAFRLATRRLLRSFTTESSTVQLEAAPGASLEPDQATRLARQVIDAYRSNIELVKVLGEHYKFKSLFYWQPTISDKPHLTAYEQERHAEMRIADPFFGRTHQALLEGRLDQAPYYLRNLTSIFSATKEPMFVDWIHLGEAGNEMVARRMLPDVLSELAGADGLPRTGLPGDATR